MTDATFQPCLTSNQTAIAKTATPTQIAASFFRFLLGGISVKRPVNAETILAAQARRETARCSVDNLLR